MTSPRRLFLRLAFLLALLAVPACADDLGPGDDAPSLDASTEDEPGLDAAPATHDAAGGLAFLAACTSNAECASGLCFNFNAKGLHCTHACQSAADCEAPSPGCSGMNVCKTP